jgi:hypothetical protein
MDEVRENNDKVENYEFVDDVERNNDLPPSILDERNPVSVYSLGH